MRCRGWPAPGGARGLWSSPGPLPSPPQWERRHPARGQCAVQSQASVTCQQAVQREAVTNASSCSCIPRWLVPILQIHISEPCWRQSLLLGALLHPPPLSSSEPSSHPCHCPPPQHLSICLSTHPWVQGEGAELPRTRPGQHVLSRRVACNLLS